jgi:hypothetical protein
MKQPGGADKLNRARQGQIPMGYDWQRLRDWMAWLNPFNMRSAYAQTTLSRDYKPTRPATMTGNNPNYFDLRAPANPGPYGDVNFRGGIYFNTPVLFYVLVSSPSSGLLVDGIRYEKYAYLNQNIPADGYYIINANLWSPEGSTVKLFKSGTGTLQTFSPSATGTQNLPFLGYFTAGTHYFYWVVVSNSCYFYQINVDQY